MISSVAVMLFITREIPYHKIKDLFNFLFSGNAEWIWARSYWEWTNK